MFGKDKFFLKTMLRFVIVNMMKAKKNKNKQTNKKYSHGMKRPSMEGDGAGGGAGRGVEFLHDPWRRKRAVCA